MAVETAERTAPSSQLLIEALRNYENALQVAGDYAKATEISKRRVTAARGLHLTDIETGYVEIAMAELEPASAPAHLRRGLELFRGDRVHRNGRDGAAVGEIEVLIGFSSTYTADPFFDARASREAALQALQTVETNAAALPGGVYVEGYREMAYMWLSISSTLLDDPSEAIRYAQLMVESATALRQPDDAVGRLRSIMLADRLLAAARPLDAIADLNGRWHFDDHAVAEVKIPAQVAVLWSYAKAQVTAGRIKGALSTLERSERLAREVRNPPSVAVARARWSALLYAQLGQMERATRDMERSADVMRIAGQPTDPFPLLTAEVKIAIGDARAARAIVTSWDSSQHNAPKTMLFGNPHTLRSRLEAACILGEAALIEGDADAADVEASEVVRSIEAYSQREALADVEARARSVRGRAALARGDAATALSELSAAATLLEHVVDPSVSLPYAHLLGALAQAQYRSGLVEPARASLARMKDIEGRYDDLGPGPREELLRITREVSGKPRQGRL